MPDAPAIDNPATVVTVGNFDAVHLGHRAILDRCRDLADRGKPGNPGNRGREAGRVVVFTFDPSPHAVLDLASLPPRVTLTPRRVALLREAGADDVVVLDPRPEAPNVGLDDDAAIRAAGGLLKLSPEAFVEAIVRRYRPDAWVEGEGFRFGQGRAGDLDVLAELGKSHGFAVHAVPPVQTPIQSHFRVRVSSSLVRWLVGRGRVEEAARCLGRAFELSGTVVKGEQRGRTIGFPTANLEPDHDDPDHDDPDIDDPDIDDSDIRGPIVPADGVYAGTAALPDGSTRPTAISVGTKPTFHSDAPRPTIEAHLLDFDADLYGRPLTLTFERWLRDQYPFNGVDALVTQLHRDVADTQGHFSSP